MGVRSGEAQTEHFDVEVTLAGRPFAMFRNLAMTPGDVWTREIPIPRLARSQKAEARLYRSDDNRLYRRVTALAPGD